MTSIDPRGRVRTSRDLAPRTPQPGDGHRRALARSTLWSDDQRGDGVPVGPQPLRARWDPVPPPRDKVGQRRTRTARRRSAFGWFIHHYGWRAYAIPVLAALTVIAVIGIVNSPGSDAAGEDVATPPPTITESATVTVTESGVVTTIVRPIVPDGSDPDVGAAAAAGDGAKVAAKVPKKPAIDPSEAFRGVVMGLLPPGAAFAKTGAGTFHIVPGASDRIGTGGSVQTFTVEVEDGISDAEADQEFADTVVRILSGPGSWAGGGEYSLRRVDSGNPDFRVTLTSQMTARQAGYCGWDVQLEASCYNQAPGRVVINVARWVRGAYSYGDDMASYREYAINHEVGHALGYHHEGCPTDGGIAPVMMQQSWSTADDDIAALNRGTGIAADGKVCRANPFPFPDNVS